MTLSRPCAACNAEVGEDCVEIDDMGERVMPVTPVPTHLARSCLGDWLRDASRGELVARLHEVEARLERRP